MAIIKARKRDYMPAGDDEFFNWQGNFVNVMVAEGAGWGIPAGAITALVNRRAEYEPLYAKAQNKTTRTRVDILAHRQIRKTYQGEIRTFVRKYGELIPPAGRRQAGLTVRDLEPTPRGKIETKPVVDLTGIGGGDIKTRCRETTDSTRYSKHPLSDGIEVKYTWVPKGEMPPEEPDKCNKTLFSKKAIFIIHCGPGNAGETFYGFFRWVNLTNPANSGQWSNAIKVVIA